MSFLRLDGERTTLLLFQRGAEVPEIVHWGARLPETVGDGLRDRARPHNWMDDDIPTATLWPSVGVGLFQAPALAAHRDGRDFTSEFETVETEGALTLHARDTMARLALTITLALTGDVLTMRTTLRNDGDTPLTVDFLAAGVFVLPPWAAEIVTFGGRWGHEFSERRIDLPSGAHVVENRRGRTSHDRFPLIIGTTPGAGEELGEAWSVHLGWSGNHRTVAERLPDGSLLIVTGELLEPGEVILPPGGELRSPTSYAAWSDAGLAGLSRANHAHVRAKILDWPAQKMRTRPVTLNTWEGTYFAHDEARLMRQATAAAALGIERFVLDDGWMPARNGDAAGLGDWVADAKKYPNGLGPLARHVVAEGMEFGLWVEPEMANPSSDAVRADPSSVLCVAGRPLRTARNQVVLDLTRPAVWARVYAALDRLLRDLPIAYFKWDMNRELVAAGGAAGRAATRAQTLAVYALMDRLRKNHPGLEIESCASGGGRADLGALSRTQRVWTSDCTDALDRLSIQNGISCLLPPEILGAHVSASPNHQTGRRHTLAFRAAVALFGHFGVELDPLTLADDEAEELRGWIALHKRLRPLLHAGRHVALDPLDGRSVIGVVGENAAYRIAQHVSPATAIAPALRLPGLDDAPYRIAAPAPQRCEFHKPSATHRALFDGGVVFNGRVLGLTGFAPPPLVAESALILEATRLPWPT